MTIADAFEQLFVANPDFEEIERSRGVFCPFEAVGMVKQEIRHAHYLAYCLDPGRPHGFGSECIRALLRAATYVRRDETLRQLTALDVHLMDFQAAQIRREWRSIDLLAEIAAEKLLVAVELKINAAEHSGQLRRYREIVEQEWPVVEGWQHLLLFLTRSGDEASEVDGAGWLPIGLDAVVHEFGEISRKQLGNPEARSLLEAYIGMLRRHHLPDERLEQLAAKLWSQHREALEFLMERRPDNGAGVMGEIFQRRAEIAQRLAEKTGLNVVEDDCAPNAVRFAIKDWDTLPGFLSSTSWTSTGRLMLLEIQPSSGRERIRMRFVLGPGSLAVRQQVHEALVAAGVPLGARKTITPSYTRLATRNIVDAVNADDADIVALCAKAMSEIEAYGRSIIPQYHGALAALRA